MQEYLDDDEPPQGAVPYRLSGCDRPATGVLVFYPCVISRGLAGREAMQGERVRVGVVHISLFENPHRKFVILVTIGGIGGLQEPHLTKDGREKNRGPSTDRLNRKLRDAPSHPVNNPRVCVQ